MMPDSPDRLRLLLKATSEAVFDFDLKQNQIQWNDNLRIWGYSPQDVEPGLEWWASRIHPDDHARVLNYIDELIRSSAGDDTFESSYRFRCADGNYRYVSGRGYILRDAAGAPSRFIGVMRDVHAYRLMFDHNPQPMWVFHRETLAFLDVNQAACQTYGYRRDEFLNMSLPEIRPPEDVPLLRAAVLSPDRAHEGRAIWRHFTRQGQLLHVEVRTQDLDFNGQPARLSIITDVSRRIQLEQQFRDAQRLEAIGQVTANIAEDFSHVFSMIEALGSATLEAVPADHPLYPHLNAIQQATNRGQALVRNLKAYAGLKQSPSLQPVWSSFLANYEFLLRKMLPSRISLEIATHSGLASVSINPNHLEQILFHLVTNAHEAIAGEGQIRLTSAIVQMDNAHPDNRGSLPAGPYLQVTVADTGCGMSEVVCSHIFEPFFTTRPNGAGMGLYTIYGHIREARGKICFDSQPGQGTEFRVYLPIASIS